MKPIFETLAAPKERFTCFYKPLGENTLWIKYMNETARDGRTRANYILLCNTDNEEENMVEGDGAILWCDRMIPVEHGKLSW